VEMDHARTLFGPITGPKAFGQDGPTTPSR
jgi:hypothetical protein